MSRPSALITLAVASLALTGCARSTAGSGPVPAPLTSTTTAASGMAMAGGQNAAASKPTATALMVCGDDIKSKVVQVLSLSGPPATSSSFANQLYRCTYRLPMGDLVLSVQHSATATAAASYFSSLRGHLGTTQTLDGLGEHAYGTSTGLAVVIKDNETLQVDATGLPAGLRCRPAEAHRPGLRDRLGRAGLLDR